MVKANRLNLVVLFILSLALVKFVACEEIIRVGSRI